MGLCPLFLAVFLLIVPFKTLAQIDISTGLINASGFELVSSQCTSCHSGRLIASQRLSKKEWVSMIRWMQDKQGLGPLGQSEEPIVRYLAKHYGTSGDLGGRRKPLRETLVNNE